MKKASKALLAKAHSLKPVVLFGAKGLTDNVIHEIDVALTAHELIKIKLTGQERENRPIIVQTICEQLKAECLQMIGLIAILYRENPAS